MCRREESEVEKNRPSVRRFHAGQALLRHLRHRRHPVHVDFVHVANKSLCVQLEGLAHRFRDSVQRLAVCTSRRYTLHLPPNDNAVKH
jgi:hypothetical protein